eukprot:m.292751 g.292751  ORF g.292751 m.292751 type:complete len:538 (+) comp20009_c0_seq2:94-1707(+)
MPPLRTRTPRTSARSRMDEVGNEKNVVPQPSSAGIFSDDEDADEPVDIAQEDFEETSVWNGAVTIIGYAVLYILGCIRDKLGNIGLLDTSHIPRESPDQKDFTPLYKSFEAFYTRHMYRRIRDCWNRPICSTPGAVIDLIDRKSDNHGWTFYNTGTTTKCLNLSSYNYLGFAENEGPCLESAVEAISKYGVSSSSRRTDVGTCALHTELEELVAEFVGKEAAMVFGMGFATNSTNLATLVGEGSLIISDELNHASLVLGSRLTGAKIKTFKHNDMEHLESVLSEAIIQGQERTHRAWNKILICVEGVYSMEGSVVNLPDIVRLKKKYRAYVYLDEAHSIGALGKTGRGVVEHYGMDVADIDIMMGTFTKSFGAAGGYICADKVVIDALRSRSHAHIYATAMSPPVVMQVMAALKQIMGLDGTTIGVDRIKQLADNSKFFRTRLKEMGFIVYGNDASPIVPLLLYMPGKIAEFSREMRLRKVAVVVVGFPATPIVESRARFCISASHTREDLEYALRHIDEVGDKLNLKYKGDTFASA